MDHSVFMQDDSQLCRMYFPESQLPIEV